MKEVTAFSLFLTILKVSGTVEIEWWLVLMPLIMTLAVVLAVLLLITAEIYCGMGYKDMPHGFGTMLRDAEKFRQWKEEREQ